MPQDHLTQAFPNNHRSQEDRAILPFSIVSTCRLLGHVTWQWRKMDNRRRDYADASYVVVRPR